MPHAAVVAAAVSASVAAVVAFELGVFKPWRQENWPEGVGQGLKGEWEAFKRDIQDGLHDIAGGRDRDMRRRRDGGPWPDDADRKEEQEEEAMLRREMDDFEMHQRESTLQKERMMREMEHEEQANDGSLYSNYTEAIKEARNADGTAYVIRQRKTKPPGPLVDATSGSNVLAPAALASAPEVESPHHHVGEASPSVASVALMSLDSEQELGENDEHLESQHALDIDSADSTNGRGLDLISAMDRDEVAVDTDALPSAPAPLSDGAQHEPPLFVSPPESVSNWTEANISAGTISGPASSYGEVALSPRGSTDGGQDSDEDWVPLQHSRPPSPPLS